MRPCRISSGDGGNMAIAAIPHDESGLPRGSGQGRVIFPAPELVEDIAMEPLSWSLTAVCAPARQPADAVPIIRSLGVSTTNRSLLPNLILKGRGTALPCAANGARFSLACQAERAVNV